MTEPILEAWYTTPYGDFKIIKRRFGTFQSYNREGDGLVTGATVKSVFEMTPAHLQWAAEGYKGPQGTYDGSPVVDL